MKIFIGWDPREDDAFAVARCSIQDRSSGDVEIEPIYLQQLQRRGLYRRPTVYDKSRRLVDVISDAPMSTQHAIARFFVPLLMDYQGWAVFMDGDVLVRRDIGELFSRADPQYAVHVVKHDYRPTNTVKKAGDPQSVYPRKNWSSVILWNCGHSANQALTLDVLNSEPGRFLHAFGWLEDRFIGELWPEWNWLAGHSSPFIDPALVHFTEGLPDRVGYEDAPYAEEWRAVRDKVCPLV